MTQLDPSPARPVAAQTTDGALGTAALILGVLGFLLLRGLAASLLAVGLGAYARTSASTSSAGRQRATIGLVLGAVSVAILLTFCFIDFVVLGHPLPHIERYQG